MLEPLVQFVCDTCHQVINAPQEGWFEWCEDEGRKAHSYRILHHRPECRSAPQTPGLHGHRLDQLVGVANMTNLYSLFQMGPANQANNGDIATLRDLDEFTEILRRLTERYYDEARLYWEEAKSNGFFLGSSDASTYQPSTYKKVIESYGAGATGGTICGCADH